MKGLQEAPGLQLLAAAVGNISYATLTVEWGRGGPVRLGTCLEGQAYVDKHVGKQEDVTQQQDP